MIRGPLRKTLTLILVLFSENATPFIQYWEWRFFSVWYHKVLNDDDSYTGVIILVWNFLRYKYISSNIQEKNPSGKYGDKT